MAGMAGPNPSDLIPISSSRTICVQFLSSLRSQRKLIPLTMLPLTMEIQLADQPEAFVGTAENEAPDRG